MTKLACLLVYVALAIVPVTYATNSDSKTIKIDIAPEYFESSVTPCSLFTLSCKSVCGGQLSFSSCDIAQGSNHASLDCTCGLVRWKSYAAAQIFQPKTIQVSKLEDDKFCDMFKAECRKTSTGVVVANGCRPSESGVPNKLDTTCISVTDSEFDRHEDEINGKLNPDPNQTPTKTTPPKPQITTVESKFADEACSVFSSLCALKRESKCASVKINSCSSLGNNQLQVQCSCSNLDFTSELVKAMQPTLFSIDSTCISKDICGLFKSNCSEKCDVTPLMNVCYVPYIITNFRVGCICGDGSQKTSEVLSSVRDSCKITTFQS